jgi:hypothetical protein
MTSSGLEPATFRLVATTLKCSVPTDTLDKTKSDISARALEVSKLGLKPIVSTRHAYFWKQVLY